MRRIVQIWLAVLITGGASPYVRADVPRDGSKVSVDMAIIEPAGTTLSERTVEVKLGVMQAVLVQQKDRTISIDTTVKPGTRAGCYKIDLVVRDRTIDAAGRFAKTMWQSGTEPCDPQPVTLGPKAEVRVRIAIKPANAPQKPGPASAR